MVLVDEFVVPEDCEYPDRVLDEEDHFWRC